MELKIDNAAIERLVNEHIRVAVCDVLSKNTDTLVSRLVDDALAKPDPNNRYDRESQVQKIVRTMIQAAASEAVNEWLTEKKPQIKKLVHAALVKKSDGLIGSVVDAMVAGLSRGIDVNCWLKSKDQ